MESRLLSEKERAAYFSKPPPRMSNSAIVWVVVACVLLSVAGFLVDHFISLPAATVNMPSVAPSGAGGVTHRTSEPLPSSLTALLGVEAERPHPAPSFLLQSTGGATVRLSSLRGKAVVLTFFDAACDDICPVLERELNDADADLRAARLERSVTFVVVNSDPLATSPRSVAPAVSRMARLGNFVFLTGSLNTLDQVWSEYGMTIEVQKATGVVSHGESLYFLSRGGRMVARATPFANEVGRRFELAPATMSRFGRGIAREVERILARP